MTLARGAPVPTVSRGIRPSLLGVVTAAALALALFPWFPFDTRLHAGARAPWTLTAPRAVSYDSAVRTDLVRSEVAAAVPEVLVLDPAVRDREVAELDRQFTLIQQYRGDPSFEGVARESALRAVASGMSPQSAQTWANASPEASVTMVAEARAALGRTLSGALRPADLGTARIRSVGFLSTQLTPLQAQAVQELMAPLVVPTLVVDQQRTEALRAEARKGQPPVHISHGRGDVLVTEGQELTAADIELLGVAGLWTDRVRPGEVFAIVVVAMLLGAGVAGYVATVKPPALQTVARQLLFIAALVVPVFGAKLVLPLALPDHQRQFLAYAFPFAAVPLVIAALLEAGPALVLALLMATASAFIPAYLPLAQGDAVGSLDSVRMWMVVAASSCAALLIAARAERPQRYLFASLAGGIATGLSLIAVWCVDADRATQDLLWIGGAAVASGAFTATVGMLAITVLRRPLGIITRIELMELTQLSHPLLRRLQDEAPGTFQHSILVGNLAERAAERVGADPLLVRIGAYYHDVGKLNAPAFFVENSRDTNPHATLDPLQSTRVIHGHVTSGVEIARREALPEVVVAFIAQHHGTRLATSFYRQAAAVDPQTDPEPFRYPGPRPQSREVALVMLADASEASVRASADHASDRIREIVEAMIRERVDEGQFDECDLSLRDLRVVADSYVMSLNAVYHPRVEYPEPSSRELAERQSRARLDDVDLDSPPNRA